MHESVEQCDVLVIGAGPAGCTAAALLGERGRDVVLLEKDAHPRFHIGESLLPGNLALLDRLGIHAEIAALGVLKPGAEFVSDETGTCVAFPFALRGGNGYVHSYHVNRAEFDAVLFANARRRGARAAERTRVTDIAFGEHGARARVTARHADGATRVFAPRFVLDGSGRDTFLAGRLRLKRADKRHHTAALFGHFRGAVRRPGEAEGYVSIHLAEDGWFWMIPLPDGIMSVGFVGDQRVFKARGASTEELFLDRVRRSPTVSARMVRAERVSEITATGNYSYRSGSARGENWFLIGDSFAFVDPMFSSGVMFAMAAGEMGADVASAWLDNEAAGRALARRAERELRRSMDRMNWLIYRIHSPVLRGMFMAPRNVLRMRDGLLSVLSGDMRPDWRARLPMLAFKLIFHMLSLARRAGSG